MQGKSLSRIHSKLVAAVSLLIFSLPSWSMYGAEDCHVSFVEDFFRSYDRQRDDKLIRLLRQRNAKYTYNDIIRMREVRNRVVFLEIGNMKAGLKHILFKSKSKNGEWIHEKDFMKKGIHWFWVPKVVMDALAKGTMVGYQGRGTGRPIYMLNASVSAFPFYMQDLCISATVGNNGFIVGANPIECP